MGDISDIYRCRDHYRQVITDYFSLCKRWLIRRTASPLFLRPKWVPVITQATLLLSVSGFIVIFGLSLGLKKQTQPASFITASKLGKSGWSTGTAWMLSTGNAL